MILRLSQPQGAILTKKARTKIAVAGTRKAISSGSFSPQLILVFQRRQPQSSINASASGIKIPKLPNQKSHQWAIGERIPKLRDCRNGCANSPSFWTQPGCQANTDPA